MESKEVSMEVKREYQGIPLSVITEYLTGLGGMRIGEDVVRGEGWSATLSRGEPFVLGSLRLETIHVCFQGEAAALNRLLASFDLKMVRGGG